MLGAAQAIWSPAASTQCRTGRPFCAPVTVSDLHGGQSPFGEDAVRVSAAGISLYHLQEQIVTTWRLFRPADILSAASNLPRGRVYTTVTGRSYSPGLPLSTLLFPLRLDGKGDSEKPLATSCPPSKPARLACPP